MMIKRGETDICECRREECSVRESVRHRIPISGYKQQQVTARKGDKEGGVKREAGLVGGCPKWQ